MNFRQMTVDQLVAYWGQTKPNLDILLAKIIKATKDISSPQGKTASMLVEELANFWEQQEITALKTELLARNGDLAGDAYKDIAATQATFQNARDDIMPMMLGVRVEAEKLVALHDTVRQRIIESIEKRTVDNNPVLFSLGDSAPNPFTRNLTAHHSTWVSLSRKLENIYSELQLANNPHSQISHLLNPSHSAFLNAIENNTIEMRGELGYLALARLNQISVNTDLNSKAKAISLLQRAQTLALFDYDKEALIREVMKLLYQQRAQPTKKRVWLGTAASINALLQARHPDDARIVDGVYLNCDDDKWSWELNRNFIILATHLGFKFKLLEEQYAGVKKAMELGDTAGLLTEIAKGIRAGDPANRSQYDRGHRCSASAEEYLLLTDLGLKATQAAGFVVFEPNIALQSPARVQDSQHGKTKKRSHSAEGRINSRDADENEKAVRHNVFSEPLPSANIRRNANELNNAELLHHERKKTITSTAQSWLIRGRDVSRCLDAATEIGSVNNNNNNNSDINRAMREVSMPGFNPYDRTHANNILSSQLLEEDGNIENNGKKLKKALFS